MVLLLRGTWNSQVHKESRIKGLRERGNVELLVNGYRVSVCGNEKFLETDSDDR